MISAMSTAAPSATPCAQADGGAPPRAMFTSVISSPIVTVEPPSQSPTHSGGGWRSTSRQSGRTPGATAVTAAGHSPSGSFFAASGPRLKARRPSASVRRRWAAAWWMVDILACPDCGGRLRLLATIEDRAAVEKILTHLGLPVELPPPSAARTPAWLPGVRERADHEPDAGGHWAD